MVCLVDVSQTIENFIIFPLRVLGRQIRNVALTLLGKMDDLTSVKTVPPPIWGCDIWNGVR